MKCIIKIMNPKSKKLTFDLRSTYLAVIRNSVGTKMFRNSCGRAAGRAVDLTRGGRLSCAFFVTSVLRIFGLIKEQHTTVGGAVRDLEQSGWRPVKTARPGDILVWEAVVGQDGNHEHIGFLIAPGVAVSNSTRARLPAEHHWTYGVRAGKPVRRVMTIYRWNF